jgi:hypothetical protein
MIDPEDNGSTMVYHEIHSVVWRYMGEAPDMTVFQLIGALEAVKQDVMDNLKRHHEKEEPNGD